MDLVAIDSDMVESRVRRVLAVIIPRLWAVRLMIMRTWKFLDASIVGMMGIDMDMLCFSGTSRRRKGIHQREGFQSRNAKNKKCIDEIGKRKAAFQCFASFKGVLEFDVGHEVLNDR